MAGYLEKLISGFSGYKELSEEQRKYEVAMQRYAEKFERDPLAVAKQPPNKPWMDIEAMQGVRDFIDPQGRDTDYQKIFVANLDAASRLITDELRRVLD
jgi:hypothetical protein